METPLVIIICLGLVMCFLFGLQAGRMFKESFINLLILGIGTLISGIVVFLSMTAVHTDFAFAVLMVSAFLCIFLLGITMRIIFGLVADAFDDGALE